MDSRVEGLIFIHLLLIFGICMWWHGNRICGGDEYYKKYKNSFILRFFKDGEHFRKSFRLYGRIFLIGVILFYIVQLLYILLSTPK